MPLESSDAQPVRGGEGGEEEGGEGGSKREGEGNCWRWSQLCVNNWPCSCWRKKNSSACSHNWFQGPRASTALDIFSRFFTGSWWLMRRIGTLQMLLAPLLGLGSGKIPRWRRWRCDDVCGSVEAAQDWDNKVSCTCKWCPASGLSSFSGVTIFHFRCQLVNQVMTNWAIDGHPYTPLNTFFRRSVESMKPWFPSWLHERQTNEVGYEGFCACWCPQRICEELASEVMSGANNVGLCTKVCLDLLENLPVAGLELYTDNYYTSPILFDVNACGTCRSNSGTKLTHKCILMLDTTPYLAHAPYTFLTCPCIAILWASLYIQSGKCTRRYLSMHGQVLLLVSN